MTEADDLTVASYNIRALYTKRDFSDWDRRREALVETINYLDSDVLGLQEVQEFSLDGSWSVPDVARQLAFLRERFAEYAFVTDGAKDRKTFGNTVLYRRDRFDLIDSGRYFFSETPDVPGSYSWDARWSSAGQWVLLRDRVVHRNLAVYNNHYYTYGPITKIESSRIVTEYIKENGHGECAAIVLGDFNAFAKSRPIGYFTDRGWRRAFSSTSGTYRALGRIALWPAIDHILINKHLIPKGGSGIRHRFSGRFGSDHFPIRAQLSYSPRNSV